MRRAGPFITVLALMAVSMGAMAPPSARAAEVRSTAPKVTFSLQRASPTPGMRGAAVTVRATFGRRADPLLRRVRGKALVTSCLELGRRGPTGWGDRASSSIRGTMPARGRRAPGGLTYAADAPPDVCTLTWDRVGRPDLLLGEAALTPVGASYLDERDTALAVVAVLQGIAVEDGAVPLPAEVVAQFRGSVVAVEGPGAAVPSGKVGYWSDGAAHLWVGRAMKVGRVLFAEIDGDVISTNVQEFLFGAPPM